MNKPIIITIAIVIFLLALGSWAYLFFYGAPQNPDELFADLGIQIGSQAVVPIEREFTTEDDSTRLDIAGSPLQQLTFRPVAGFVAVGDTVRYAERGTGHLYEINIPTGTEVRVTNTTIPQVQFAIFNSDGTAVVLQSSGSNGQTTVGRVTNDSLNTSSLPPLAQNISFIGTTTVAYTLAGQAGTTGYEYDITTNSQVATFSVPFNSVTAHYLSGQTYVSNRHAPELEGALWKVNGTTFTQEGSRAFGFITELGTAWRAIAYTENDTYVSEVINVASGDRRQIPVSFIPEKCDWGLNTLWCAAPSTPVPYTYLKDWYQGTVRANDSLWVINPATETAELLVDPTTTIGRQLDITDLVQSDINRLIFINRQDNTLWIYDRTLE